MGTQKNCLIQDSSFDYPQHMVKLMDKKILENLHSKFVYQKNMNLGHRENMLKGVSSVLWLKHFDIKDTLR